MVFKCYSTMMSLASCHALATLACAPALTMIRLAKGALERISYIP